ncbi:uncharacterized protein LOC142332229 [Lycorma delicatula]|uniref:uncharacterized protein LOC142332229 n=1 Tax=Lycorma delicatula TaxID=130591 RepID=UPI003F516495
MSSTDIMLKKLNRISDMLIIMFKKLNRINDMLVIMQDIVDKIKKDTESKMLMDMIDLTDDGADENMYQPTKRRKRGFATKALEKQPIVTSSTTATTHHYTKATNSPIVLNCDDEPIPMIIMRPSSCRISSNRSSPTSPSISATVDNYSSMVNITSKAATSTAENELAPTIIMQPSSCRISSASSSPIPSSISATVDNYSSMVNITSKATTSTAENEPTPTIIMRPSSCRSNVSTSSFVSTTGEERYMASALNTYVENLPETVVGATISSACSSLTPPSDGAAINSSMVNITSKATTSTAENEPAPTIIMRPSSCRSNVSTSSFASTTTGEERYMTSALNTYVENLSETVVGATISSACSSLTPPSADAAINSSMVNTTSKAITSITPNKSTPFIGVFAAESANQQIPLRNLFEDFLEQVLNRKE